MRAELPNRNGLSTGSAQTSTEPSQQGSLEADRLLSTLQRSLAQAKRSGEILAVHVVALRSAEPKAFSQSRDRGQRLMNAIANGFAKRLRDGDLVAPLDRNRLCLLQRHVNSLRGARTVAEKLIDVGAGLMTEFGADSCTVGTAFSDTADHAVALVGQAAAAAEQAAHHGKLFLFSDARSRGGDIGVSDVRLAIDNGEFALLLQPQLRLGNGAPCAVEALLRMRHPLLGLRSPQHFLPTVSRAGLQCDLDLWVLSEACRLRAGMSLPDDVRVSVNVHPELFELTDVEQRIEQIIGQHRLRPRHLELELLESQALDAPIINRNLATVQNLGVHLVLDDFGTGYSSFERAVGHAFDKVKLPRELIGHIGETRGDAAVRSVLRFCREVELETTAEGIETPVQHDSLRSWDCDNGQGFLLGHPMSAAELTAAVC